VKDTAVDVRIERLRARNPHAAELAKLASLAVQVEPELLRALRMLIPGADGGAEADVWLSDLVDAASPLAMRFVPAVRARLQEALRSDLAALERAAATTARMHAAHSEVVRIEEKVTVLALRGDPDAEEQIGTLLAPVIARLEQEPHAGLARWAVRVLAEMEPGARRTGAAWELMRASSMARVGATGSAATPLAQVVVYLRLTLNALEIHTTPQEPARTIELPLTDPLLLEVSWQEGETRHTSRHAFMQGETIEQPLVPRDVVVRTLSGETARIVPEVELDDWAYLASEDETPLLVRWLQSPTGGRVPASHISRWPAEPEWMIGSRKARRLYCYYDDNRWNADSGRVDLQMLADEVVLIFNGAASVAVQGPEHLLQLGPMDKPIDLLSIIVAGLEGAAINTNADITANGLARYVKARAQEEGSDVTTRVSADYVIRRVTLSSVEMVLPQFFRGQELTLTGTVERTLSGEPELTVPLPPGDYTIEHRQTAWARTFTALLPQTRVDFRWRFHGRWVIVAGSGGSDEPLTRAERLMIDPIAHALVDAGHGLIGGGWPGVDAAIATAFEEKVRLLDGDPVTAIRQYVSSSFHPVFEGGTIFEVEDNEEEPLRLASAMIVIGGGEGALRYARKARQRGIPIFEIPQTGGAAERLQDPKQRKGKLSPLTAVRARQIAQRIMEDIREAVMSPRPSAAEERPDELSKWKKNDSLVVLVHGFKDDPANTWGNLAALLSEMGGALAGTEVFSMAYPASWWARVLPGREPAADIERMADFVREELRSDRFRRYQRLTLIAHSLGGLAVQRALLDDPLLLARVETVILFATPLEGLPRRGFLKLMLGQIADLVDGGEVISRLSTEWKSRFGAGRPFRLILIAGDRDEIVPSSSALPSFPGAEVYVMPGGHQSLVKVESRDSAVATLLYELLADGA
jgi:pimeloyl-ACP methyl ester carboxylesterase